MLTYFYLNLQPILRDHTQGDLTHEEDTVPRPRPRPDDWHHCPERRGQGGQQPREEHRELPLRPLPHRRDAPHCGRQAGPGQARGHADHSPRYPAGVLRHGGERRARSLRPADRQGLG